MLLDRELVDRLLHLPQPVLVESHILRGPTQFVLDRLGLIGRDDLRRAALCFQQALGPPPGAGDEPARGAVYLLAFGNLAAVFERRRRKQVVAVAGDELR